MVSYTRLHVAQGPNTQDRRLPIWVSDTRHRVT